LSTAKTYNTENVETTFKLSGNVVLLESENTKYKQSLEDKQKTNALLAKAKADSAADGRKNQGIKTASKAASTTGDEMLSSDEAGV